MLLSIEMMSLQATLTGASRTVTHEVPVSVIPERLWPDYQEPNMPDIDVSFLSSLRLTHTHTHAHTHTHTHTHHDTHTLFSSGKHISSSSETVEEHNRQNEDNEQLRCKS